MTSSAWGNTDPKLGLVHGSVDEVHAKGEAAEVVADSAFRGPSSSYRNNGCVRPEHMHVFFPKRE